MVAERDIRILLQLLHTVDNDPSIAANPSHHFRMGENETVDRIVCKLKKYITDQESQSLPVVMTMSNNGYPLLPLIQDMVSVRLYGVQTTKGVIAFEPTVIYA